MAVWTGLDPNIYVTGKAISFEEFRAVINDPLAIAEGAANAPRISRRAIHPGGAEIDGIHN
ncbi:MAG: hypothetical protein HRU15_11740, partial [Planctomycetes bacterium]|nr:hypothetical protein [Planctomycetota bacterium]